MRLMLGYFVSLSVFCLFQPTIFSQPQRYELGRRLREFEKSWEQVTDKTARSRALKDLPQVTNQFFGLKFGEAGKTLDLARLALLSDQLPGEEYLWAMSQAIYPAKRIIDATEKTLEVELVAFYKLKQPANLAIQAELTLTHQKSGRQTTQQITLGGNDKNGNDKNKRNLKLDLPADITSDCELDLTYSANLAGKKITFAKVPVYVIRELDARIKTLSQPHQNLSQNDQATLKDQLEQIKPLLTEHSAETDLPIVDWFEELELLIGVRKAGKVRAKAGGSSVQLWRTWKFENKKTASFRMMIPKLDQHDQDKKVPLNQPLVQPLVVAMHGAGGSENMFFDSYGAGQIVKECEKRKWMLISLRSDSFLLPPNVKNVVDQLAEIYPVDKNRIFIAGHSMGAAQTIDLVQRHPGFFAAAAAMGGGGRLKDNAKEVFRSLPIFVGVGEKDFALSSAKGLNKAIQETGAKQLTFKQYPELEHLVIVREALPDVFAIFDTIAK